MPGLSRALATLRPGVFAQLQARIDAHQAGGGDLVPLQIGDTHLAPPAELIGGADPALYRYGPTAGLLALREALAASLAARGLRVDPRAELLLGAGATHALSCVARAILAEGDEALLLAPYWPLAHGVIAQTGATVVECVGVDALAGAVTPRTRAIYLITPNNPDGSMLTRAELERVAALAEAHDLWVIADEVYADFAFDAEHVSIATLPGMAARTLTAFSLSKSHALAGARVGYVAGPAAAIELGRRVSTHTVFNVPVVAQRTALAALADGAFLPAARATYRASRDQAIAACAGLAGVEFARPPGGAYLFLDLGPRLDGRSLASFLEHAIGHGVLLAPGEAFGAAFPRHARLCHTAVPAARLAEGIARLRVALDTF